jgi:hypothetical protein
MPSRRIGSSVIHRRAEGHPGGHLVVFLFSCTLIAGAVQAVQLQGFCTELQGAGSDINLFDKEANTGTLPRWGCDRLVVRRSTGTIEIEEKPANKNDFRPAASSNQDRGCFEIEATLTSFLPTILRYEAGLKRDYYRAVNTLLELQGQRKAGGKKKPDKVA